MSLALTSLLSAVCFSLCLGAARRGSPEVGVGGLEAGRRYEYHYSSVATVHGHSNISLQAEVSLQLLSGESENELLLVISNVSMTWITLEGNYSDPHPIGDLSNWFSLVKESTGGGVLRVYYPADENLQVVAFKKSLSQLVSVGGVAEREAGHGGIQVVRERTSREHQHHTVVIEKELRFDEMGVMISAESLESTAQGDGTGHPLDDVSAALFSQPLSSHSRLVLRGTQPAPHPQRPQGLVADTPAVTQLQETLPVSDLSPLVSDILRTCVESECPHRLSSTLRQLALDDVGTLLSQLQLTAREQLLLLDALVQSGHGGGDDALRVWLSPDAKEEVVKRVLLYLATGKIIPNKDYVEAVLALLSAPVGAELGGVTSGLQHTALLSLGGMARLLTQQDPDLVDQIADVLSSVLDHVTGHTSSSRLRRSSAAVREDPLLHAVLLDSMGNSQSQRLLPLLVDHVTSRESSLATKHAAVKALGRYESVESAEALLTAAETSPNPSVRHVAGVAYSAHPRATRDISHLLSLSPHHRSRRQLESGDMVISNVSMPTVSWNQEFGESNISVDLSRTVRNSFDIDADPHSSRLTFSLYDEATFDANLLLSGGQQHTQMWGTEVCLQGTATYDINILQDFSYNQTAYHYSRLTSVVDSLSQAFSRAYVEITSSESSYSGAVSNLLAALDSIPARYSPILDSLSQYQTETAGVGVSEIKETADEVFALLNDTYSMGYDIITSSLPGIRRALDDLHPDRPRHFSESLLVDSLPFTESRFLVRYLPSAPQQAMAGIYDVYRSSAASFESLSSSYEAARQLVDPQGVNSPWLSPLAYLREASTQVSVLLGTIEASIENAELLQLSAEEVADLQLLQEVVASRLQSTFDLAEEVGQEVLSAAGDLAAAFAGSSEGFDTFTRAFENSRQQIDAIFGQKFHPNFPRLLKSCDYDGCGHYPATSGGVFNEGVDLRATSSNIISPLSGNAFTFDPSLLPVSVRDLYSSSNYSGMGVILQPAEPSHLGVNIILPNLVPESGIGHEGMFVTAGEVIGRFPTNSPRILHVEVIKEIDGTGYRLDPTSYLQPRLEPNVSVELECNDVVMYMGGVVIERRSLTTSPITRELVGNPLVIDVPNHEFPQPFDLVVRESGSAPPPGHVTFLQNSTSLMVGQIPVQLDFSITGTYQLNYSQDARFLSKTLDLSVTPSFLARAQGSVRVGSTVFATVELQGVMLDTSLPLALRQDASTWPMAASSSMDVILVPSALNLTSRLFRLTTGASDQPELLQSTVEWAYLIPPLHRTEFYYRGLREDDTPPLFTPLGVAGAGQDDCFVRQLPGRGYDNPAFEILYQISDSESRVNVTLGVGTYERSDDIFPTMELGGDGAMTVYNSLSPSRRLYFTLSATNQNTRSSFASCSLLNDRFYDRSPPLARINPIGRVSSHPSMIRVLVALFDEAGLAQTQEVAIGRLRGVAGTDALPWTPFNTSLISTSPVAGDEESILQLYSFGRPGRLVTDILQVSTDVSNASLCASLCETLTQCLSFDYSQTEQNCILHDGIEGPASLNFENIFATPELQSSASYKHYERLGAGNSTQIDFSGLSLEHNTEYFINIRLRNTLGYETVVSSPGFLVDLTPPLPGLIVARNRSRISVFPEGCQLAEVPLPGCIQPVLPRISDMLYVDDVGSAVVFNGPVALEDARYTSTRNVLTAHWYPFLDPESGIFGYTWCIGTSPGSCDLLPHTDPHAHLQGVPESWSHSGVLAGLDLPEGDYYITVRATNEIAYGGPLFTVVQHTTPYRVDTTPPVIGEAVDVSYNSSTNHLSVQYDASDTGGEVARVELALGHTPLDTGVLEWALLGNQSDGGVTEVDIPDGVPVWLKLRATDAAGLQSVLAADSPFIIDHTPPIRGRVYDGHTLGSDAQYLDPSTPLCVNWMGFGDPHTGLGRISWAVRRGAGQVSARDLTAEEREVGVACYEGLSLSHNTTYYSVLTVYNGADEPLSVTESSNGIHTDMTPPTPGTAYHAPPLPLPQDSSYSTSPSTLRVRWAGFQDYESGISGYSVSVFRQGAEDATLNRAHQVDVGGEEGEVVINQLRLENGDYVLIEVTAINGAGGRVSVNTSGVIVDLTPPEVTRLVDTGGANSSDDIIEDLQYQAADHALSVSWEAVDMESGISRVLASVYEIREGRRMRVYPEGTAETVGEEIVANQTSWTLLGLVLNSGSRYVTSLTFVNGAGLEAVYESDGVVVDLTPPNVISVSVSSDAYLDTDTGDTVVASSRNRTEVRWMAVDTESGIQHYLVGVVDTNGTLVAPDYTMFEGTEVGGSIETFDLSPDGQYRVAVVSVNQAGVSSESAYSAPFRLVGGDSAGVVVDGGGVADLDFTDEVTVVTSRFYGFSAPSCGGGIARYEWAVGEGAGDDEDGGLERRKSVLQFTSRGITDNGDGSGHTQLPVAGLLGLVGRRLYVTVRGVTGCGRVLESVSDGFVIDTSPPSLEILATGRGAIAQSQLDTTSHETYQVSDVYSSIWSAADSESGVPDDVMVQVGTFPGGDDLTPGGAVPGNSIRGRVLSGEGTPTYVTVTAANGAGLESVVTSESITMDTTPPNMGQMTCTASGYPVPLSQWAPVDTPTNYTGVFSCSWEDVADPHSGVRQYEVAIGTSATDQSVMSRTVVGGGGGDLSGFTSQALPLPDHTLPYYVVLYATNGAGLEGITFAGPVYFDISPPIISGSLYVYPNFKMADYVMGMLANVSSLGAESAVCLLDTDVVSILFEEPQDLESGDDGFQYQLGIGLRPGSDDVFAFESFLPVSFGVGQPGDGPALYHRLHPLDFSVVGRSGVYFSLRVRNSAGHYAILTSSEVFIKSNLTLEQNWIFDGVDSSSDVDYQTSTFEIGARLFFGINCPIRRGQWAVESVDGNLTQPYVDLIPFQYQNAPDGNIFHVVTDQVQLYDDETYRILVQATDYTGEVHILRSNGVTVTTLGLVPGLVRDGPIPNQDLNYQESVTSLSACWTPFGNGSPEQEIAYYEVAAGSDLEHASTRSDVAPFTNVGLNLTHTFTGLQLNARTTRYFITVRAISVSGASIQTRSNGIIVGFGHSIVPGAITLPRYQADGSTLSAYWSDFESSLPIRQYEWALGSTYFDSDRLEAFCSDTESDFNNLFDISGFESVGLDTYISLQGLELRDNTTYFLTLRVLDQAKRCIAVTSPSGVTIDQTPPTSLDTPTSVVLGPVESHRLEGTEFVIYVTPGMELEFEWEEFEDAESGIDYYQIGFFRQSECGNVTSLGVDVADFVLVGDDSQSSRQATLADVTLEVGVAYVGVVSAVNRAGVTGYAYSQPVLLDDATPTPGSVKDGREWSGDLAYQSDLSTLSATFSHAKLSRQFDTPGDDEFEPCPPARAFNLSEWGVVPTPTQLLGFASSSIQYSGAQVSTADEPSTVSIVTTIDTTSTADEVLSGAYQTTVDLSSGGTVQADVTAATGSDDFPDLRMNTVTSVLFIDSGDTQNVLAKFESDASSFDFSDSPSFQAFGVQIYRNFANTTTTLPQRVILWTRDSQTLGQPVFVQREIPGVDLDVANRYRVEFSTEQLDTGLTRRASLYINDVLMATLYGLPSFSHTTRIVFHALNRQGYVPPRIPGLSVTSMLANVTLPRRTGHLCDFGAPFHSGRSPVVQFQAWAGTRVGLDDVQDSMFVSAPCTPCLPGPCDQYSCNVSCTSVNPYTFTLTFANLTLSPGYVVASDNQSDGSDIATLGSRAWFQPAMYYVTVEAITASGRRVRASSNGVTVDTSPPIVASPIQHFDVSFSTSEPIRFQGNNSTILARWLFQDEQSGIANHAWAIGTTPFASNVQDYTSVGLTNQGVATGLTLDHNVTYYVTVVAMNGAGLVANVTSEGVTYIATQLNETLLQTLVEVEFTEQLVFEDEEGEEFTVRRTDRDFRAAVSWEGVGNDIQDISWYIGSVEGLDDILPPVNISLVNIQVFTAAVDMGVILQGSRPFTNVSEVIALEEGKAQDPADNLFFFEPGRLLYHSIEFCNLVHVCTVSMGIPSIVIRGKDVGFTALFANSASRLEVRQTVGVGVNRETLHPLDKEYRLSLVTDRGLNVGSRLYAGFLNRDDVTKTYRALTPYISNPFLTMGLTSREIARRFTEFGGPSFYVSFLGQGSLNAPLEINVTFDSSLDWDVATPEIGFWDTDAGVWREASETCNNGSRVDYTTFTIAVRVCSTVLDSATPFPNRPRTRRQADPANQNFTSGSGSGLSEVTTDPPLVLAYLDRPVQFIVMRIGNLSTNSAPELLLPATPLEVMEDTPYTIQLEYTDAEFDTVTFELLSVSRLGNVTLTSGGLLTYDPCLNCVGTDIIQLSIREVPIVANQIPLEDFGEVIVQIIEDNDQPLLYFYGNISSDDIIADEMLSVFIDSDRFSPAVLVGVAAIDFDGYSDDLQMTVLQDAQQGTVAFRTRLNAVNVFESLPATLTFDQSDLSDYQDYVTFHSSHVTYLPNPGFVGNDTVTISVRDSRTVLSRPLQILIEVLPSPCLNDGTCGGSAADPRCEDVVQRRSGFDGYNCSCLPGFAGEFCEQELDMPQPPPVRDCPVGIPVVQCDGDPCGGATCPSHPLAECRANFCGSCRAEWYLGDQPVTCHADDTATICDKRLGDPTPLPAVVLECNGVQCPCPAQPFPCPPDSILVERRVDNCCVLFECSCPNISCPLLLEMGEQVQPVPNFRGNQFPGRCCPEYTYEDINECETRLENICSGLCVDQEGTYSCDCPEGRTLASDQVNCGVCPYNGMEYLLGDRVKIGCNWCLCRGDQLNQERWHCTANSCDNGCLSNGMLHPLRAVVTVGSRECACEETDVNSQDWMCET